MASQLTLRRKLSTNAWGSLAKVTPFYLITLAKMKSIVIA